MSCLNSALPEDEWFVETSKSAIKKLPLRAFGSYASKINEDHIILLDEIVTDLDDSASSLSTLESFESVAFASMGELNSLIFIDPES